MRYRIYFEVGCPVEVHAYSIKLTRSKDVQVHPKYNHETCDSTGINIGFCETIKRIADDHDRTIYEF